MALPDFPNAPVIMWFRDDLRTSDNSALTAAASCGKSVVPVFIFETDDTHTPFGAAQQWWLHHSLTALSEQLSALGNQLILRKGSALTELEQLIVETGAGSVVWNRRYSRYGIATDTKIKTAMNEAKITAVSFPGRLMHEPTQLKSGTGSAYRVYTPFWKMFSASISPHAPLAPPSRLHAPPRHPSSDNLDDWKLLPAKPNWSGGLAESWTPGTQAALERLEHFLKNGLKSYDEERNFPCVEGTSGLSPHLAFGEISPAQIWARVDQVADSLPAGSVTVFRKELVWREFAYHLLVNFTELKTENYNTQFDRFPWVESNEHLRAWQRGRTGYPIVDAGMRQLYETGWMHNRVRMIVGSFLVKHLLIDWRQGEKWFWDTLVDADAASNTASWQWVAGSGADAAPYFRIFNPITQGEKFDAAGSYVRQWLPELTKMPNEFIHKPWEAPHEILELAGVTLGETYPSPIVDHKQARARALNAYQTMRGLAD